MVTRARGRLIWWYLGGVAVIAVLGVAAFLWMSSDSDAGREAVPPEPTGTSFPTPSGAVDAVEPVAPFTQADADRITAALNSQDAAAVGAVLVPDLREPFEAATGEVLPAGSTVTLLLDRFVAVEPALGSVPMLVRGDEPGNFLMIVSHVDGQWLVVSTEEVQ